MALSAIMAEDSPVDKRSDLLGHYKLLEKIAQGGMAEIFKAETYDPHGLRREVVIKRILPHIASHQEFIDMLVDEAKIAVHFNHGNIAQIYDLGKVGRDYFIVMEYVAGKTLQQIFKRATARSEKIPIPFCLYFISELCAGLAYMHGKSDNAGVPLGVVHRDISPQNVIVSYAGNVKIIDFGVAKASDKITITESGVLKGKFAYMSPEQADGDEIDARSDIFSAGVVLWEILTGERLFRRKNNTQTLKAVKKAALPSLGKYHPEVPKELEKILGKALARVPKRRYDSAEDFQVDLTRVLYAYYPEFKPTQIREYLDRLFSTDALIPDERPGPRPVAETDDPTRKERVTLHSDREDDMEDATIKVHSPLQQEELTSPHSPIAVGEETASVNVRDIDFSPAIALPNTAAEEKEEHEDARIEEKQDAEGEAEAAASVIEELSPARIEEIPEQETRRPTRDVKPAVSALVILFLGIMSVVLWRTLYTASSPSERISAPLVPVSPVQPGFVLIESDPSAAAIFINDVDTGKKTPAIVEGLVPGETYHLGLTGKGFKYHRESFTVAAGKTIAITVNLEANHGMFSFVTDPPGAYVTVNGRRIGQSPILNYAIDPGTVVHLEYSYPGYQEWETTYQVFGGEERRLFHRLKAMKDERHGH